jgi:hypothetical protein
VGRVTHGRLQLYLSAAAGVMLGAAFFHVMPDALKLAGEKNFGWFISLGVVGLFCIEGSSRPTVMSWAAGSGTSRGTAITAITTWGTSTGNTAGTTARTPCPPRRKTTGRRRRRLPAGQPSSA